MNKIWVLTLLLVVALSSTVSAADFATPTKIRCTCYTSTEGSVTASGDQVREGIIAGKRSWLGKVAILYDLDMNIIGFYEFKDTGAGIDTDGDGKGDSIKNGKSVDVYRDTYARCKEWVKTYGDYVYMQIVEVEQ